MIGFFDSGAGGLSVVREAIRLLPDERYIYYSDNAHCPYGEKSREYVTERARAITRHLRERGCGIVTVACNTATAAAISSLRAEFDMPFVGMEPAVKPAAALTRSGVVGVLATAGTLRAEKYHDTRDRWSGDIKIVEHVGEGFVRLVESGTTEGPEADIQALAKLIAAIIAFSFPEDGRSVAHIFIQRKRVFIGLPQDRLKRQNFVRLRFLYWINR